MRKLFAGLGIFGWPLTLLSEIEDFIHNPTMIDGHHFFISAEGLNRIGMDIHTLKKLLKSKGYDVWSATDHPIHLRTLSFPDDYCITVRIGQRTEVEQFMVLLGVPIRR